MRGHIHAELMAQYAEDARETKKPWERWEFYEEADKAWFTVDGSPLWHTEIQYRRKPRTITINGREVPEPMRSEPAIESQYFMPQLTTEIKYGFAYWRAGNSEIRWLSKGLCHSTKEAAIAHAEALLSFTEAK